MSGSRRQWVLALLAAIVVGGVLYWLTDEVVLAIATGVVWGSAIGLTDHFRARFPDAVTGTGWTDSRWTGLGVAVISFGALLGVNTVDSLGTDLRFGLAAVVLGIGYVGYLTGSLAERERARSD